MQTFLWHPLTPKCTWLSQNKSKKTLRKYWENFFRNYALFYMQGGGAYLRKLQYCFYWSNCFTLLKLCHVCLYILLGKVSTLLEWADELLCLWSHAVACLWQCFYTTSGTPLWIFFENSSDLLASLIEAIYLFLVRMSTSLQETTKLDFLLVKKKQHQIEQYILNYDINWRRTQ